MEPPGRQRLEQPEYLGGVVLVLQQRAEMAQRLAQVTARSWPRGIAQRRTVAGALRVPRG